MPRPTPPHQPAERTTSSVARPVLLVAALAVGLGACDTGDGTELREPTAPTSVPPLDTTPLSSMALSSVPLTSAAPSESASSAPAPSLPGEGDPDQPSSFDLFAPWVDGGPIDERYGCDGSNVSPPLSWAGLPAGTTELAVSFVDEDRTSDGQPFVHWVMSGIPADDPGALGEGELPLGATQALNFFGDVAYAGPCPDPGTTSTYRLTLHALPQQLEVGDGAPATEFLAELATLEIGTTDVRGVRSR